MSSCSKCKSRPFLSLDEAYFERLGLDFNLMIVYLFSLLGKNHTGTQCVLCLRLFLKVQVKNKDGSA